MNERRNKILSRVVDIEQDLDSMRMQMWILRGFILVLILKQWGAF